MKLDEALPLLQDACGIPFGELFQDLPADLRTNKGNVGQLLLLYLGLELNSDLKDFEDGELKTNKAFPDGSPKETMFITQISKQFDTLITPNRVTFYESNLYKKIRNLVFLPVVKESDAVSDWYFARCVHVRMEPDSYVYEQIRKDYRLICDGLQEHIEYGDDGNIHTTSGDYIQVRSKDSKPYHPIYSQVYGREISNKNHAFYFKKAFMQHGVDQKFNE